MSLRSNNFPPSVGSSTVAFLCQPCLRPSGAKAELTGRLATHATGIVEARAATVNAVAFGFCCLFVFSIPWENTLVLPGLGTISRVLGLIAFPVAVLAVLASGKLRGFSTPLVLMSMFVVWAGLSYLWTTDSKLTTLLITTFLQNLGMVWLIWQLAYCRERQLILMRAYIFGTLISAGDTLSAYFGGKEVYYQRFSGSGFDPNDLGLLLALSLPISFYLATTEQRKGVVWTYRIQQIVSILAIGLTSSRASLFALAVALVYLPLASLQATLRERCGLFLLVVVASTSMLVVLPESSWKRWGGIGAELELGTWSSRKLIWSFGWELFRERPILGVGAGNFAIAAQQMGPPLGAHNTFLSVLVEEGLMGFALLLLLLLSLALPTLRLPVLERSLWLVVLAAWCVGVFTLTWENRKPTWFLFGMLAAWLSSPMPSPKGVAYTQFLPAGHGASGCEL